MLQAWENAILRDFYSFLQERFSVLKRKRQDKSKMWEIFIDCFSASILTRKACSILIMCRSFCLSFKENLSFFAWSKTGSWFSWKIILHFGLRPSGGDCSEEQLLWFSLVKYSIRGFNNKNILKRLIFFVLNFLNFRVVLHAVPVCTTWPIRAADSAVGTKEKCIIQCCLLSVDELHFRVCSYGELRDRARSTHNKARSSDFSTGKCWEVWVGSARRIGCSNRPPSSLLRELSLKYGAVISFCCSD